MGTALLVNWCFISIPTYLDRHLKYFEIFNQIFMTNISLLCCTLFSNFVTSRLVQFDMGYIYSLVLVGYNCVALAICFTYIVPEPFYTWWRLREMRKAQIRLAIELKEFLIKEAKIRKERRKQRKIKAFHAFRVQIGDTWTGDEEAKDDIQQQDEDVHHLKRKNGSLEI